MFYFCWPLFFLWLFLVYKLLDRVVRIPKRTAPTSVVNNIMITGCDTGFGHIFAQRLASKGFRVFASCLTDKGKEELVKGSSLIKAFVMDVRDIKSIERGFEEVKGALAKGEGLWALVNNAGVPNAKSGPVEWLLREDYLATCSVNLFGMIDVTRLFLPLLKPTRGRIINMASIAGRMGFPGSAPYCVSKWGVQGYSDCLRYELVVWGISVHVIEPGFHLTKLTSSDVVNKSTQEAWDRLPENLKQEYGEEYLHKSEAVVEKMIAGLASPRLDDVVDCYEHATLGYFPRGRYMPGKDARFLFWPLTLFPEWVMDWFMTRDPKNAAPRPRVLQRK